MVALFLAAVSVLAVPITLHILVASSRVNEHSNFQEPPIENPYDYLGIIKVLTAAYHFLNQSTLSSFTNLFHKYGDTFVSRILGRKVFFTCDARNIKHVLVTRFVDYDAAVTRAHLFHPITERGIFAVDGPQWKTARDLYRNVFSRTRSIVDLNMLEEHVQTFFCHISSGTPLDLQPLFLKLSLDINTAFTLRESVESLSTTQSDEKGQFTEALLCVKRIMARDGFLGPVHVLLSKREYYNACSGVHRYVEQAINAALENQECGKSGNTHGYSLLQALVRNSNNVPELRDNLVTILIAGTDSVASLLSSTFWFLARDNRVLHKLRAMILDGIGREPPTYDQVKSLTYLRYVLNEALRVHPPVPLNQRVANKDTTLVYGGGADGNSPVHVKKGSSVVFSTWATHRSSQVFGKDSHTFCPERWETLTAEALLGYIPFSNGPRVCPGQQYALVEASYLVVRILQKFSQIDNYDTRDWAEKLGLNLSSKNGVMATLVTDSESVDNWRRNCVKEDCGYTVQ